MILRNYLLIAVLLHLSSILAQSSIIPLVLDIPLYFDFPSQLSFLIPKTQDLINQYLENEINKSTDIVYKATIYDDLKLDAFVFKLGFSDKESFYASPFGRTITLFQTDYLIAANEMSKFCKDIVVSEILGSEIDELSHGRITDDRALRLTHGSHHVKLKIISSKEYAWNKQLLSDLITTILNELQRFITLSLDVSFEVEEIADSIELDVREKAFTHNELNFFIYLSHHPVKINKSQSHIIIPQKGAVQAVQVSDQFTEAEQIAVLETFTALLLRLIGFSQRAPKSPFIRIDFLIRKQIYRNFQFLTDNQKLEINRMINQTLDYERTLKQTWEYIYETG